MNRSSCSLSEERQEQFSPVALSKEQQERLAPTTLFKRATRVKERIPNPEQLPEASSVKFSNNVVT